MHALAAASSAGNPVPGLLIIGLIIIAYWVPTAIAVMRHVPNTGSVIVINALLGWSVVGWIVALAMACRSKPPPQYLLVPPAYPAPMPFLQQPPPEPAPEDAP